MQAFQQLAHRLQKPGWVRRTLSSKNGESGFWLLPLITEKMGSHCGGPSHHCCKPLSHHMKWLPGDLKGQGPVFFPFIFHFFFPFVGQKLKIRTFEPWGSRENLISRHIVLLGPDLQCSRKNHKEYKETENYGSFKEKNNNSKNLSLKKTQWQIC